MFKALDSNDSIRFRNRLILLLSLLTFSNIACFTIITSFTKSNFLNAIAGSAYFINIYNQKPYFLLYGLTGISFVIYSCIYYVYGSKVSFERRIKREMLAMLTTSLVLYCIPQVLPGFHKQFLPAMGYFVVIDIFDELIIVQTWSLINYCINIRESKRYQYVFLLSGSMGALLSGYLIIEQVPGGNQLIFLLMTVSFSAFSYGIIRYIFYSYRINISISAKKESLKTLLTSQKRHKIIKSIVLIVILIGVFNLFFKVLFDVQINAHYFPQSSYTATTLIETEGPTGHTSEKRHKATDPKTTFIGHYKAGISVVFVISVCAFFIIIPKLDNPMVVYTLLIIVSLVAMLPIISRIPRRYVLSLRESIQRRSRLESVRGSLISYQPNLILDQYKIARDHHNDMFNYLYLLNLIRNSYASELDEVLIDLLKHENRDVRFETVSVISQVEATRLVADLEQMCQREEDPLVKETCLQAIAAWGPANGQDIYQYLDAEDAIDLLKYNLTIVHRWGSNELKEKAERKILRLLKSEDDRHVLAGIWLVGELKLTSLKDEIQLHFGKHSHQAFDTMLEALSKMDELDLFVAYLEDVGFDKIRNYAALNKHLARFESRAFDVIFDMLIFMTRSKSFMDLEKCLRTLRFLPSQDAVDFLVDTLFRFPNPHVKREALLCISRLRKADENLDFDQLVERLTDEIDKCRNLCTDYQVIAATRPESLLLLELARNIETQVWMIFQILDLLNPELKVMDSFFRIKWHCDKKENVGHTRAKSIEYLEAIIEPENTGILELLESIRFDDGLFSGAVMPADHLNDVDDVYQRIFEGQDYWLKLSAVWGMPRAIRGRFEKFLLEVEAMMPLLEKFHLIKDSPMLKGLSMMELMLFAEFIEIVDFRASDDVFKIGDPANALLQNPGGKSGAFGRRPKAC